MHTRRDFLKKGFAVGAAFSLVDLGGLFAAATDTASADKKNTATSDASGSTAPALVAVRDGDRVSMLNRAMTELGGMERFVKKGQTVVIKPNIGWDVVPERSANTHPDVVRRLVEMCLAAGASQVSVFDHTCDAWERAYKNSGIVAAVEEAGGKVVPGHDESWYREVEIPGGVALKTTKVHSLILDSDVFINAPVLKHHGGATMTACMKNLMGAIWDRRFYHQNNLHQCIADFIRFKRPALNVLDAYAPMMRNGPRGKSVDDLIHTRSLLASTDIVAIDAAGARMLGHAQDGIEHVKIAGNAGLGTYQLDTLKIERVRLAA
ncbi:tat (twin-arginine translocation) pathway signal sequence [Opitutaceae bacterium TAV5]|nr:tat (twin-arginine translocation) pathway signal sequence [Opitutaceae bacterium TAV5]